MDIASAVILAIVQGLTEFLPVSSSGHLVIARQLLHMDEALLTFDILVHLGTLISVVLVFWNDVKALIGAAVGIIVDILRGCGIKAAILKDDYRRLALFIIIASVPAAIMGMALKSIVYTLFSSTLAVGIFLLATGTVLWLGELFSRSRVRLPDLTLGKALCIGVAQGFAIAPGFSRSGATISAGLLMGLSKEDAARFSFLLSIPVILGAGILELRDISMLQLAAGSRIPVILGFITSIVSGYVAIHLVLAAVRQHKLTVFAIYTWILGISVIIWSIL
ncbi:MAG: undecaprenyl-diphosphate phosphatase [Firmicutes bacterium]|jgi:undecaprenyl-diphosphatase|nr:undecaprenyl-diphosphate phosphatase [Bacillota bacterium]